MSSTDPTFTAAASTTSTSRSVAADVGARLQPPPPQPRRLHGRPHPTAGQEAAAPPPPADCSLTTNERLQRRRPVTPTRAPEDLEDHLPGRRRHHLQRDHVTTS